MQTIANPAANPAASPAVDPAVDPAVAAQTSRAAGPGLDRGTRATLRVALVTEGGAALPAWQASCLQMLQAEPGVEVVARLIPHGHRAHADLETGSSRRWRTFRDRARARCVALADAPSPARLPHTLWCAFEESHGGAARLARVDRDRLAGLDLDLLVCLRDPRGLEPLTHFARRGLWGYDHLVRGAGWVLEEIERGAFCLDTALRVWDAAGPHERVLARATVRAVRTAWSDSWTHLSRALVAAPARACRLLGAGVPLPTEELAPPAPAPEPAPALVRRHVWHTPLRRVRATVRTLATVHRWNIGVVRMPVEQVLAAGRLPADAVQWLPVRTRSRFQADPFAVRRGAQLTLLVEDVCPDVHRRGVIAAIEQQPDGSFGPPHAVLIEPHHLSYPCLVEDGDEIYLIPESHERREVRLYRATQFPTRWEPVATLLKDRAFVDPTVFRHDGRWWMFCTTKELDSETQLLAFFADELRGPWREHLANPIVVDVSGARPAGRPFLVDGALVRPAQDCARSYGRALVLHRVETLTPTEFRERRIATIAPDPTGPYPHGLHCISVTPDGFVIDGMREAIMPRLIVRQVTSFLRRRVAAWPLAGALRGARAWVHATLRPARLWPGRILPARLRFGAARAQR